VQFQKKKVVTMNELACKLYLFKSNENNNQPWPGLRRQGSNKTVEVR
jgi:hypothetical protein